LTYAINEYIPKEDLDVNNIFSVLIDHTVSGLINTADKRVLETLAGTVSEVRLLQPLDGPTDLSRAANNESFNEFLTAVGCLALSSKALFEKVVKLAIEKVIGRTNLSNEEKAAIKSKIGSGAGSLIPYLDL
jgi:hypothetical protein